MPSLRGKTWTTTTPATVNDAQYWEDHLISDADAQKAANSVQTVNNTAPDANGNVDVTSLPAGGTAGQVLTKISSTAGDADWLDPASGGHSIQDDNGTTMTQQPNLQFVNADVSNDSVNNRTVVDCKGAKGDAATVTVGNTSTLPAGSSATVTNSGTSSAAVLNFGIPAGADGQDGTDGVSVTGVALESTSGKVKTYRMSFSDGNHFDYDVTDGADGTGAGDMLQTDYDPNSDVLNAGGIPDYVASHAAVYTAGANIQISSTSVISATDTTYSDATQSVAGLMSTSDKTKLDGIESGAQANVQANWTQTTSTAADYIKNKPILATVATSGSYNDLSNKPTIPAAQIQSDWNQTNTSSLDYIKNKPTQLGHNMLDNSTIITGINSSISEGTSNDDVVSAYGVGTWSNTDTITLLTTVLQGDDAMGTWDDDATWESGSRSGWLTHSALYHVLSDDDVEIELVFDVATSGGKAISALAYRIDDEISTGIGGIAIKFNAPIESQTATVGVKLKRNRTKTVTIIRTTTS